MGSLSHLFVWLYNVCVCAIEMKILRDNQPKVTEHYFLFHLFVINIIVNKTLPHKARKTYPRKKIKSSLEVFNHLLVHH